MTDATVTEIAPDGGIKRELPELVRTAALSVPQIFRLLFLLMKDPRVDVRRRILAGAAVGYAVLPIDIVPDWLPVIGRADDVLVAALAMHLLVEGAGEEIVAEHWSGPPEVLRTFTRIVELVAELVPRRIRLAARAAVSRRR